MAGRTNYPKCPRCRWPIGVHETNSSWSVLVHVYCTNPKCDWQKRFSFSEGRKFRGDIKSLGEVRSKKVERVEAKPLQILDLCCGAGGASLGFRLACEKVGRRVDIVGVDVDKWACKTYQYNKVGQAVRGDIRRLPFKRDPLMFDVIIAGPPCPTFSVMTRRRRRRRRKKEERLVLVVAESIALYLPKGFFFENVPGILRFKDLMKRFFAILNVEFDEPEWDRVQRDTLNPRNKAVGVEIRARRNMRGLYEVTWGVLDAVNYGVPQCRKRLIVIGIRT